MKIKKVTMNNFLSFGEGTLEFEDRGLVLINGFNEDASNGTGLSNGSGKSSALNAVVYALYGKTTDGRNNDTLLNRSNPKNLEVTLEFEQNGVNYALIRGRKKNKLTLMEEDKDITKATIKETQDTLENIINIPEYLFKSTIFFDGATVEGFPDKTDKEKKAFLEGIVNLEPYRQAHELTKIDLKDVKDKKLRLEGSIQVAKQTKENNKRIAEQRAQQVETSKAHVLEAENELKLAQEELDNFMDNYEGEKESLSNKLSELSTAGTNKSELESKRVQLQNKINEVTNELNAAKRAAETNEYSIKQEKSNLENQQNNLKSYLEIARSSYTGEDLSIAYDYGVEGSPKSVIESITPSGVDRDKLQAFSTNIKATQAKIKELEGNVESLNQPIQPLSDTLDKLNNLYTELNNKIMELQAEEQQTQLAIQEANNSLYTLENAKSSAEYRVSNAQTKLDGANSNLGSVISMAGAETNTVDLEGLDKELEGLVDKEQELNAALTAFSDSGIISHIISTISPALTERTNYYLSKLTGGAIQTEFTTLKKKADGTTSEKLDVVMYVNDEEAEYRTLSRGEKRRTDIAIGLALLDVSQMQTSSRTNVLFLDELFESLDNAGSEVVIDLLKEKVDNEDDPINSILVVSHQEELKALFTNVITIVKKDGISHLED